MISALVKPPVRSHGGRLFVHPCNSSTAEVGFFSWCYSAADHLLIESPWFTKWKPDRVHRSQCSLKWKNGVPFRSMKNPLKSIHVDSEGGWTDCPVLQSRTSRHDCSWVLITHKRSILGLVRCVVFYSSRLQQCFNWQQICEWKSYLSKML